MEHYYSLAEINLAIQETDSLLALLKVADYRINETFLLHVSLEQIVMNLVFNRAVLQALVNEEQKTALLIYSRRKGVLQRIVSKSPKTLNANTSS